MSQPGHAASQRSASPTASDLATASASLDGARAGARDSVQHRTAPATVEYKEKTMANQQVRTHESFTVRGENLVDRVKELIHQGNVRRIIIRHENHVILELPLTVAAIGVVLAPMLAAVGALAAVLTECTLEVERLPDDEDHGAQSPPPGR